MTIKKKLHDLLTKIKVKKMQIEKEKKALKGSELATINDLVSCYNIILGRSPDELGFKNWSIKIKDGIKLTELTNAFFESDEYKKKLKKESNLDMQKSESQAPNRWFHSVKIDDNFITSGDKPYTTLCAEADIVFKHSISDKTVLDIGAWDGFFSFEAERRGAKSVLATDHFCWSGDGWGTDAGFLYARDKIKSNVKNLDVDVFDLDPKVMGKFDVTLFLGVLYHLTDPYNGLKKAAEMTNELLIIETETRFNKIDVPLMRFFKGSELNNDNTNYWAPNIACINGMLSDFGFNHTEFTEHPNCINMDSSDADAPQRHIIHAWRNRV